MKKARKGFTLVELLIVVAILGVLSASMIISTQNATANAKANAIKANLDTCRSAALIYYATHLEKPTGDGAKALSETDAATALKTNMPDWTVSGTSATMTKGGVVYTASGETPNAWKVEADYTSDNDADKITTLLTGKNGITATSGKAELTLIPALPTT